MEGERHLLSNHADIKATINNAIEHFLYEESFREEQKICYNLVRRGQALGDLYFSTLSTNNKRNQRKSLRVNFTIIIVAPLEAMMFSQASDLE